MPASSHDSRRTVFDRTMFKPFRTCVTSSIGNTRHAFTYLLHGAESFFRSQLDFQLIKKFPAFYGTWKFITVLTSDPLLQADNDSDDELMV